MENGEIAEIENNEKKVAELEARITYVEALIRKYHLFKALDYILLFSPLMVAALIYFKSK